MARDGYIVMSIVFYIAGLIYIILPEISPMTICISSGIALIAYGIIKIIGYCSNDLYCLAFQYDLACGIFLIVLGVIMLCSSTKLIPYLSVGLGALLTTGLGPIIWALDPNPRTQAKNCGLTITSVRTVKWSGPSGTIKTSRPSLSKTAPTRWFSKRRTTCSYCPVNMPKVFRA